MRQIWLIVLCLSWIAAYPAWAATLIPEVIATQADGQARILFKWQEAVRMHAAVRGQQLVLSFDKPVQVNVGSLVGSLPGIVSGGTVSEDAKRVTLDLAQAVSMRSFIGDGLTGVDMMVKSDTPAEPKLEKPVVLTPVEETPLTAGLVPDKTSVVKMSVTRTPPDAAKLRFTWPEDIRYRLYDRAGAVLIEFNQTGALENPTLPPELRPWVKELQSKSADGHLMVTLPMQPRVSYRHHRDGRTVAVTFTRKEEEAEKPEVEHQAPREKPAAPEPTATALATENPATKPATQETAAPAPAVKVTGPIAPIWEKTEQGNMLRLPWKEPVGAAVFTRSGQGWAVFDATAPLTIPSEDTSELIGPISQMAHSTHTILTWRHPPEVAAPLVRKRDNEWQLHFVPGNPAVDVRPIRVMAEPATRYGPAIRIPLPEEVKPLTLDDPNVGDSLLIIPLQRDPFGTPQTRRMVDMDLLATRQGLAIVKKDETVQLHQDTDGNYLAHPVGLHLSPVTVEEEAPKEEGLESLLETNNFLPHTSWERPEKTSFTQRKQQLHQLISSQLDEGKDAAPYWLALAKFYMAEGMFREADSLLRQLAETSPKEFEYLRAAGQAGITSLMLDNPKEAREWFSRPELASSAELPFWEMLTGLQDGSWNAEGRFGREEEGLWENYSPPIQEKTAYLLADKFINEGKTPTAFNMLERLRAGEVIPEGDKKAQYYYGLIAEKAGKYGQAVELWQPLKEQTEDNEWRFRAGLELARLQYRQKQITPEQAIEQLEKLRMVWRGDEHEAELLRTLGQLYVDMGKPADGLRVWRELVTSFPDLPVSEQVAGMMTDTFVQLFNRGGVDNLKPLDALSLYYEFRELTPLGKEGDIMIQQLADQLARVDLLDRATALLTHQVQYRLSGEDRARVGGRLALLHLMNGKPEVAQQVLQDTKEEKIGKKLAQTRSLIMADALIRQEQYDKAIGILGGQNSEEANRLMLEALWKKQAWHETANWLEAQVPAGVAELSEQQAEYLVRLAIARQMEGNSDALEQLRTDYEPLMKPTAWGDSFDFLTGDRMAIDHTNMDKMEGIIENFSSFLERFEGKVKKEGLSETVE